MQTEPFDPKAAAPLSHALIGIARDLELRMLGQLQGEGGHTGLRPSLGPLLSLVWLEARPLGELAQALGVSKQACSQLVGLALGAGFLVRRTNARGARGQRVALSARGRTLVEDAIRIMREAESDYAERVGPIRLRQLAASVAKLYRSLDVQPRVEGGRAASLAPPLGGLPQLAIALQRRLIDATAKLGHRGLKPSQALVLPLVERGGSRVRDLARRHHVSRQSISVTGLELESLGYLRREPDAADRRGIVLVRTPRGDRLLVDAAAAARTLDRALAAELGKAEFEALREAADRLFTALRPQDGAPAQDSKARSRLRIVAQPPAPAAGESDLEALASRLRSQLGEREAARLGALLVAREQSVSTSGGDRRKTRRRA